jgi:hypothetical protein
MTKTTTNRIMTFILIIGMFLGLAANPQVAQAATNAEPTIVLSSISARVLPSQQAQVNISYTIDSTYATMKNNVYVDTQLTIESGLYDLAGLVLTAKNLSGNTLGTITLQANQKTFWLSNFGGALSRHAVKRDAGKTLTYQLFFTPSRTYAGARLQFSGITYVGTNKAFSGRTPYNSNSVPGTAEVKVTTPPIMSSPNLSGPYMVNQEKTFAIELSNPDLEMAYSGLMVEYIISSFGGTVPAVSLFEFSSNGGANWGTVTQDAIPATGTLSGKIGNISLAAGQKISPNLLVKVEFTNPGSDVLFPVTLILRDPDSKVVMETITSVMAVNTSRPTLDASDLSGTYNAGTIQEFHVSAINQASGTDFTNLSLKINLTNRTYADVQLLEYYDYAAQTWVSLLGSATANLATYTYPSSAESHALPLDSSITVKFRVAFKFPGAYIFNLALDDGVTSNLPTISATAVVNPNMPSLNIGGFASPFTVGIVADPFTLSISNPASGVAYATVRMDYVLSALSPVSTSDIASLECLSGGTYQNASKVQGSGVVSGSLPPLAGQPLNINSSLDYTCKMSMVKEGSYTLEITLVNAITGQTISGMTLAFDVVPQDIPDTGMKFIFLPFVRSVNPMSLP